MWVWRGSDLELRQLPRAQTGGFIEMCATAKWQLGLAGYSLVLSANWPGKKPLSALQKTLSTLHVPCVVKGEKLVINIFWSGN